MNSNEKFVQGFNNGYLLAKHEPTLMAKIVSSPLPKSDYFSGFLSGQNEYHIELRSIELNNLTQLRTHSEDRENSLEK